MRTVIVIGLGAICGFLTMYAINNSVVAAIVAIATGSAGFLVPERFVNYVEKAYRVLVMIVFILIVFIVLVVIFSSVHPSASRFGPPSRHAPESERSLGATPETSSKPAKAD